MAKKRGPSDLPPVGPLPEGFDAPLKWFLANPASVWPARWRVDRAGAVRIAAAVVELVLSEWRIKRPGETAPIRTVEAALANPTVQDEGLRRHLQALMKACTGARKKALGSEHLIAEAARSLAGASVAPTEEAARKAVGEALGKTEEHLLYRLAVAGDYGKEAEVRAEMIRHAAGALTASD